MSWVVLFGMGVFIFRDALWMGIKPSPESLVGRARVGDIAGVQEIKLGDVLFRVPEVYLQDPQKTSTSSLALHAILPDVEGMTQRNWRAFTDYSPHSRVVRIYIRDSDGLPTDEIRWQNYKKFFATHSATQGDPQAKKDKNGLKRYLFEEDSGYEQELFLARDKDGNRIILLCTLASVLTPSPNCIRHMDLGNGLSVSYSFRRSYLLSWPALDDKISRRVEEFRQQ